MQSYQGRKYYCDPIITLKLKSVTKHSLFQTKTKSYSLLNRPYLFVFLQLAAYREGKPLSNGTEVSDETKAATDVKVKNMHNKVSHLLIQIITGKICKYCIINRSAKLR